VQHRCAALQRLAHRAGRGHIAAVGFEMYCRLLEEVVQEAKGRSVEHREPEIVVPVAGSLPPDWIPAQVERLEIYRRIASSESPEEIAEIGRELADRFGPLPPRALHLLHLGELRVRCRRSGVKGLHVRGREAHFEVFPGDYELTAAFLETPGMVFTDMQSFRCTLTGRWEEDFDRLACLLGAFEACAAPAADGEEALATQTVPGGEGE